MDFLFKAASEAVLSWSREKGFNPGIVCVMHTFGGNLCFHPHIHMLLAEGGLTESGGWTDCKFFPERVLKERFKYYLVKYLREWVKDRVKEGLFSVPLYLRQIWYGKFKVTDFYSVTVRLYDVIWYVWIGEKLDNADFTTRYIGRYAKRPCLSEARIIEYSFEKQIVVFLYKDKLSGTFKKEAVSVEEFIGRLIRHIPDKGFRMIRYYGFYANAIRKKSVDLLYLQIVKLFGSAFVEYDPSKYSLSWRDRIKLISGSDPLVCPHCKIEMELIEVCYRKRDGTLKVVHF